MHYASMPVGEGGFTDGNSLPSRRVVGVGVESEKSLVMVAVP